MRSKIAAILFPVIRKTGPILNILPRNFWNFQFSHISDRAGAGEEIAPQPESFGEGIFLSH